jgi:multidrug efflux pump subunit AcrA (membrane-fusion protein)
MRGREALAASKDAPVTHPTVSVIRASPGEPSSQIALPGNVEPLYTAALFARVNGYVQQRSADIGMKVHAGQVLAIISAPEIDQQLSEAKATVGQSMRRCRRTTPASRM